MPAWDSLKASLDNMTRAQAQLSKFVGSRDTANKSRDGLARSVAMFDLDQARVYMEDAIRELDRCKAAIGRNDL